MRLDHVAFRVSDRAKTAQFFIDAFGYRVQTEFDIEFPDKSTAKCIALEPPEKVWKEDEPEYYAPPPWTDTLFGDATGKKGDTGYDVEYHLAPEIFVSDGSPGSIVGDWVAARGGIGGIHHMAYQVPSVEAKMKEWKEKGYAEFTTEEPMRCPGLTQIFTAPSKLTGIIYEFIEREAQGFCKDNVKDLMLSTKGL